MSRKYSQLYERTAFKDLRIGDRFTWIMDYNGLPQPVSYIVDKIHPTGNLDFSCVGDDVYMATRKWVNWKPMPSDHKDLIRYLDTILSKEESILEKIKYLDKRYQERKAMCS